MFIPGFFFPREDGDGGSNGSGDGDGDNGSGDGDNGSGAGDGQPINVEELIGQAVKAATDAANQTADKRINQILARFNKNGGEGEGDGDGKDEGSPPASSSRETALGRKLLKLAVRDEISASVDEELRPLVRDLALEVSGRVSLTEDTDEDALAREIVSRAGELATQSKSAVESRLREKLKKSGALKADDDGQPPKDDKDGDGGDGNDDPLKQFEAGASKAKERFERKE